MIVYIFKIIEFFNLNYEISKYRAIEYLIFEIIKNRKLVRKIK